MKVSGYGCGWSDKFIGRNGRPRRKRFGLKLDDVPQRETGMTAYEMLLSDTGKNADRRQKRYEKVVKIFNKMGFGRGCHRQSHGRKPFPKIYHHGELDGGLRQLMN